MDRSRKENREGHEKTFQYKSRQEALLDEEMIEDKLTQLLAFTGQLEGTPTGAAEIQRRVKLFGVAHGLEFILSQFIALVTVPSPNRSVTGSRNAPIDEAQMQLTEDELSPFDVGSQFNKMQMSSLDYWNPPGYVQVDG